MLPLHAVVMTLSDPSLTILRSWAAGFRCRMSAASMIHLIRLVRPLLPHSPFLSALKLVQAHLNVEVVAFYSPGLEIICVTLHLSPKPSSLPASVTAAGLKQAANKVGLGATSGLVHCPLLLITSAREWLGLCPMGQTRRIKTSPPAILGRERFVSNWSHKPPLVH